MSRQGPPMSIHRAEVLARREVTPGMLRLTLGGAGLTGWATSGTADEYVRLWFPAPAVGAPEGSGDVELRLPEPCGDSWQWADGVEPAPVRCYSVRAARPPSPSRTAPHPSAAPAGGVEVDVDFVVHEGGLAAEWARGARPGDALGMSSAIPISAVPEDAAWVVVLADAPGLPAALRLLEGLPVGVRATAVLEVERAEHEQPVLTAADAEVVWLHGGNGHGRSRLAEALCAMELPAGPGFVWAATEGATMRTVRKRLRFELGLPAERYRTVGYWTERAEQWQAHLESLDEGVRARLAGIWSLDDDRDEESRMDEWLGVLEEHGL